MSDTEFDDAVIASIDRQALIGAINQNPALMRAISEAGYRFSPDAPRARRGGGGGPSKAARADKMDRFERALADEDKEQMTTWTLVKKEVHDALCVPTRKYASFRKELAAGKTTLISVLSVAISAKLGLALGLVTPFVGTGILFFVGVGKFVWCERTRASLVDKYPRIYDSVVRE